MSSFKLKAGELRINSQIKELNHTSQATECINVTSMKPSKRRALFIDGMNKNGFTGFIKHKQNNQTYYIFTYKKIL